MFLDQMDNLFIYFELFVNFLELCFNYFNTFELFQHVSVENWQPFVHYGASYSMLLVAFGKSLKYVHTMYI